MNSKIDLQYNRFAIIESKSFVKIDLQKMGACVPTTVRIKVAGNFILLLQQVQYYLNIKLKPQKKHLKSYFWFYDDHSLPNQVYPQIKSVRDLKRILLQDKNNLYIENGKLVFSFRKKKLSLSIENQKNQEDIVLQSLESIKKIVPQNKTRRPYSSIVKIKSYGKSGNSQFTLQGSGVIISNNYILTVAHNIYSRTFLVQVDQAEIYVYTQNKTFRKLKVLNFHFSDQYNNNNQIDIHRYDLAILQIQKSDIIKEYQIMPIAFDAINNDQSLNIE